MLSPVIFELPTRSPRKYRGKYPERVNAWSYGRSPSQTALALFLGINRPVHVELNDGRRFIVDMRALIEDKVKLNVEFIFCIDPDVFYVESLWEELTQDKYDRMLQIVRMARAVEMVS